MNLVPAFVGFHVITVYVCVLFLLISELSQGFSQHVEGEKFPRHAEVQKVSGPD